MTEEKVKFSKKHGVYYMRDGDLWVHETQKKDYGKVIELASNKNVLDFGGHCGFFNLFVSEENPKAVVTIEPDVRNFPALERNCADNTTLINAAMVNDDYKKDNIDLYLGRKYSGSNSVEPFRGRQVVNVPVVKWKQTLRKYRIQFIKCDCEGGEYFLDWSGLPSRVETIAMEFHFHREEWCDKMWEIDEELQSQGFKHVKAPKVNRYFKGSNALYTKL